MSDAELPGGDPTLARAFMRRWGVLVAILLVAGALRFDGLSWDDGTYPHPDERFMTMVASAIHTGTLAPTDRETSARAAHHAACVARHPATAGVGDWFDTDCSDFNPANAGHAAYPYGQFPLTVVRIVAEAAAALTGWPGYRDYGGIHLVGRTMSASADLLTLLVVFLLGRLLWGRAVGVLGAAFYAVAVLPIQIAHFWTVDSFAALFASVSLLYAVRLARFGQRADALAFGAAYALALASKISVAPLLAILPLAALWAPGRVEFRGCPDWLTRASTRLPAVLLGCAAALLTFRIASPYAFSGTAWYDLSPAQSFVDQVQESRRLASGIVDTPPNWQWLGRTPWLSAGRNLVVWGLGIALAAAAAAGLARRGWRLLRWTPMERARALPWLWAVGYFLWMGQQWVASMRYLLPIYPTLCLFAAAWLVPWWRARRIARLPSTVGSRFGRGYWPAAVGLGVIGATATWALAFHQVHTTLHPYVAATNWVLRNVPGPVSAPIATEQHTTVLLTWGAAGEYGDGTPLRVAATVAPASGSIDRLRLHHVAALAANPSPVLAARVLDADGAQVATTGLVALPQGDPAGGTWTDLELPLRAPLAVIGGRVYRLQVEVTHGAVALTGSRIAHEGSWNDAVPTRAPRLAPSDMLDLAGPSGTVPRGASAIDPVAEGYYVPLDLAMVTEDDEAKRARLVDRLDQAEWVIIPNNRFYDSMSRNPLRFPLSTRFYDALFAGELGFSRHLVVASLPRIAGIAFDDQALPRPGHGVTGDRAGKDWAAEEAFSVYDHPTVFVFGKTAGYSRTAVERIVAPLDLTTIDVALRADKPAAAGRIGWSTLAASGAPDGLLRRDARAAETAAAAAAPREPAPDGAPATVATVIAWYTLSLLLGWMAWPWLATLWPDLPDRGYGVARTAGLAALATAAWWLTWLGLDAWSARGLAALALVGAAVSVPLARHRLRRERHAWRSRLRYIAAIEGAFLALFALGVLLRALHPDLWAPALGGEKPMDYAFFNSVLATGAFPPPDPWFSDGRLNYYYFGWVLVGVLAKLGGAAPNIAYNLALPTWFALTGVGAFSLAWNACARAGAATPLFHWRWLAGGVALAAAVLLGNLDLPRAVAANAQAVQALAARADPVDGAAWREALTRGSERWFWAPSRTVGERAGGSSEIGEFPAFTFLYGDLHPHLLAWPLQLFVLTALLTLAAPARETGLRTGPALPRLLAQLLAAAFGVALLRATNTWDWPLYLALGCAGTVLAGWRCTQARGARRPARTRSRYRVATTGLLVAALVAAQAVIALPFTMSFVTGTVAMRWFDGTRTALAAWFAMQGWFVLVIAGWCLLLSREPWAVPARGTPAHAALRALRVLRWSGLAFTLLLAAVVAHRGSGEVVALGAQIALLAWLVELLWRNAHRPAEAAGLLAAALGFGLALAVEFVVIGQDMGRMNTYFKFHLQSWILLAIASGVAIAGLAAQRVPQRRGRLYGGIVAVASLLALAYLPLAVYGRSQTRFDGSASLTLDGEAFLAYAVYDYGGQPLRLADDRRLILWLREHAGRDDVVLEAQLPEYRWGSRIAAFTGRPTVLGYRYHESQQRPIAELGNAIELRRQNVAALYGTTDQDAALRVLRHYRVRYVVVGGLERAAYPGPGIEKFKAMAGGAGLEAAFAAGDDVIYRVIDDPAAPAASGARW